jgi:uncharacterized protein (TIGR02611 family)
VLEEPAQSPPAAPRSGGHDADAIHPDQRSGGRDADAIHPDPRSGGRDADDASAGLRQRLKHRHTAFRARLRRRRSLDLTYRVVVGVLGAGITLGGLLLIPFPGPGWLVVFLGLGLLASEFEWAHRLLHFARAKVTAFAHWAAAQALWVRGLLALSTFLIVVGVFALLVWWRGVPAWVPFLD